MKFICDIGTVQTYLEKWGQILAKPLPKFREKVGERREKWCDGCGRERKEFRQWYCPKFFFFLNCRNWRIKKKEKKENWTVARVILRPKTILPYFYKLLLWPISYLFSSRPTNNITFLFTNNHSSYQQFMKVFVKKFAYLAFCQKWMIKIKKNSIVAIELPKLKE